MGLASKIKNSSGSGSGQASSAPSAPPLYGQQQYADYYGAPAQPPYPGQENASYPQPYASSAPPQYPPHDPYAQHQAHGPGSGFHGPGAFHETQLGYGPSGSPYPQEPPHPHQTNNNMQDVMAKKLQFIVQSNGLQHFYDPSKFQAVLQKVAAIDFGKIAAQWKIGKELAYDLAPLALYDIIFYCDDSGSMAFEENGDRIEDLKLILAKVSGIANLFDDDGIRVRFMNSNVNGDIVRGAADVEQLMLQVRFSGVTPLGTNLDRKVIQPFVLGPAKSTMAKPVLAIVITDGEPYGESRDTIIQVIRRTKDALAASPYGRGALAIQIAQVGKDAKTQKFLESLDKDPVVGNMIDCTSYYEMEEEEFSRKGVTLTPELWLLKMCVGAIDPEYDSQDG